MFNVYLKWVLLTAAFVGFGFSPLVAQTVYEEETYMGQPVITQLDVNDLEDGQTHELYFKVSENLLGQPFFVPVTVIKGEQTGSRFMFVSGMHGNEVNSMLVTYHLKEKLNPTNVKGTITFVHGINIAGLLANTRGFRFGGNGEVTEDLNRIVNADLSSNSAQMYISTLWNNLLSPNADHAIDIHTHSKNHSFPLFSYADLRDPDIRTMTELIGADIVKMDNGEPGSLETSFVEQGVPAFTLEIGSGERLERDLVIRAVNGIMNILLYFDYRVGDKLFLIKGTETTFFGNTWTRVVAERGGYTEIMVEVNQRVQEGDLLVRQFDPLGHVVSEQFSEVSGMIASVKRYPYSEPGDSLIRVIYYDETNTDQVLEVSDTGSAATITPATTPATPITPMQ